MYNCQIVSVLILNNNPSSKNELLIDLFDWFDNKVLLCTQEKCDFRLRVAQGLPMVNENGS